MDIMISNFIKARLNKDNLWNIMFLILPSLIILIAQSFIEIISCWVLFLIIFLSPYLITRFNVVKHKDNEFISSSTERKLGEFPPKHLGFIVWCGIPFTTFWVLLLHSKAPYLDDNIALYSAIFWFIPTIYFIFKNIPISIMFNKKALTKLNEKNMNHQSLNKMHDHKMSNIHKHNMSALNYRNRHLEASRTSSTYRYLPGNRYHK